MANQSRKIRFALIGSTLFTVVAIGLQYTLSRVYADDPISDNPFSFKSKIQELSSVSTLEFLIAGGILWILASAFFLAIAFMGSRKDKS